MKDQPVNWAAKGRGVTPFPRWGLLDKPPQNHRISRAGRDTQGSTPCTGHPNNPLPAPDSVSLRLLELVQAWSCDQGEPGEPAQCPTAFWGKNLFLSSTQSPPQSSSRSLGSCHWAQIGAAPRGEAAARGEVLPLSLPFSRTTRASDLSRSSCGLPSFTRAPREKPGRAHTPRLAVLWAGLWRGPNPAAGLAKPVLKRQEPEP